MSEASAGQPSGPPEDSAQAGPLFTRVAASYDHATRAADRRKGFFQYYLYRPLSLCLTVPLIAAGVTANQVTVVRLALVALAFVLFAIGGFSAVLAASVLYFTNAILDFVDGNIARYRGPIGFGDFFEAVADPLVRVLTPAAIAIGLYLHPDAVMISLGSTTAPALALIAGGATALASSLKYYISAQFALLQSEQAKIDDDATAPAEEPAMEGDPLLSTSRLGYLYQSGNNLLVLAIVVFAFFDSISLYLAIIFLTRGLTFPIGLVRLYRRSRRELDRP